MRWLSAVLVGVLGCGDVVNETTDASSGGDDAGTSADAMPDATSCSPAFLEYAPVADEGLNASPGAPIAQTVTPVDALIVETITLPVGTNKGNGIVDARIVLRPTIGGNQAPDGAQTLAVSQVVPNADILDTNMNAHAPLEFTFDPPFALTANRVVAITLEAIGGASGSLSWRRSSTPADPSDPYPDGTNWSAQSGSFVQGNDILDLAFRLDGQVCD